MALLSRIADDIEPSRYAKQIRIIASSMVDRAWDLPEL
jgi:hypothetical protein